MRQRCGPAEGYEVARFSRPPPASRSPAPPAEARYRLLGDGLAIDHDLVSTRVHNANDWAGHSFCDSPVIHFWSATLDLLVCKSVNESGECKVEVREVLVCSSRRVGEGCVADGPAEKNTRAG